MSTAFVLDCSVVLAAFLPDEDAPQAVDLIEEAYAAGAAVPHHFLLEVTNGLLMACRHRRIARADWEEMVADTQQLPVVADDLPAKVSLADMTALAFRRRLTTYDAAYLELSIRRKLPLATLDRALADAARAEGIPVL